MTPSDKDDYYSHDEAEQLHQFESKSDGINLKRVVRGQ